MGIDHGCATFTKMKVMLELSNFFEENSNMEKLHLKSFTFCVLFWFFLPLFKNQTFTQNSISSSKEKYPTLL